MKVMTMFFIKKDSFFWLLSINIFASTKSLCLCNKKLITGKIYKNPYLVSLIVKLK